MDFTPFPLLFNSPLSKALLARNTRCPLSAKLSIMPSAVLPHSPSGLLTWVPYHFVSDPGPRKDPMSLRESSSILSNSVSVRKFNFLFPRLVQSMSLDIDMKMILPLNCSGSHFGSVIIFWTSSRIPNVVNPWEICPLETPSAPRRPYPNLWDSVFPKIM